MQIGRYNGKKRVERVWCLSAIGERGAEASQQRGRGRRQFFCVTEKRVGEGRQGDNASKGANSREPQSIPTDSYSLCIVCMCACIWAGDRKLYYVCKSCSGSVYAACKCLHVKPQQSIQSIHHCADKISPLTLFKITNSIFNVLDNLVLIIHCKSIQSHRSCGTQSIHY